MNNFITGSSNLTRAGKTSVILHFSWDDCNNTVVSKEDKKFKLTVVEK
ncbi:MAG: hypothetical protein KAW56_02365 [Candidatus Marinimicrobia bacterium]|nr:hypothetical protein [Candidatus Neomarinimicrobiota bacterium]